MVYGSETVPLNEHIKWIRSFLKCHYATYFGSKDLAHKRLIRLAQNNYASFNEKYALEKHSCPIVLIPLAYGIRKQQLLCHTSTTGVQSRQSIAD